MNLQQLAAVALILGYFAAIVIAVAVTAWAWRSVAWRFLHSRIRGQQIEIDNLKDVIKAMNDELKDAQSDKDTMMSTIGDQAIQIEYLEGILAKINKLSMAFGEDGLKRANGRRAGSANSFTTN